MSTERTLNPGQFYDNIKECKRILDKMGILKKALPSTARIEVKYYDPESRLDIAEYYLDALRHANYNFLLVDDSIIQFQLHDDREESDYFLKYSYFQYPFSQNYETYLENKYPKEDNVGDIYLDEFYDFLAFENPVTDDQKILRYDYQEKQYSEGIHMVSHIHVCHYYPMCLSIDKLITPYTFIFFMFKQMYREKWVTAYTREEFRQLLKDHKNLCKPLDKRFYRENDKYELLLV